MVADQPVALLRESNREELTDETAG